MILLGLLSFSLNAVQHEGEYSPAWSPDGRYVAYHKNSDTIFWDLMIKDLHTGKVKQITSNRAYDTGASWSPDGKSIIFSSSRGGNRDIYIYDLASQKVSALIVHESMENQAQWSPDGKTIAFLSRRSGSSQLHLYDVSSGKSRQLTDTQQHLFHPSWSSDGKSIVFDKQIDQNSQLFLVDATSGEVNPIYSGKGSNMSAKLHNNRLTFSTNRDGNWDLLEINLKTGREKVLIGSTHNEMKGVWDPQRKRIAYSKQNANGVFEVQIIQLK